MTLTVTDIFDVVHHSHEGRAVVERRIPTERVTEAWRAICRHVDCIGRHCDNHQPMFWHQAWMPDRDSAEQDAADHNNDVHGGAA